MSDEVSELPGIADDRPSSGPPPHGDARRRQPRISFVIVNWNTRDLVLACIESIRQNAPGEHEIVVVDNASSDGSAAAVRSLFPAVTLIENAENLGYARANNQAIRVAAGEYVCLINSDAVLTPGAAALAVAFMDETPRAGLCGVQLLNEDGSRQNSIANMPTLLTELTNKSLLRRLRPARYPGKEHPFPGPVEVESVIGACMFVRAAAIREAGLLDERYFFFLEETDWCQGMRNAGFRVYHLPGVRVVHYQGRSARKVRVRARIEYWRSRYLFFAKHRGRPTCAALRAGLLARLSVDLAVTLAGNLLTLFLVPRLRAKLRLTLALAAWHLLGMPEAWGLRGVKSRRDEASPP